MIPYRWRWPARAVAAMALGASAWGIFAWATAGPGPVPASRVAVCQQVVRMNLPWVSSELSRWTNSATTMYIPNSELSVFKADANALQGMNVSDTHFYADLQTAGILLSSAADSLWNTPSWSNHLASGGPSAGGVWMSWEDGLAPALAQVGTDCA